MVKNTKGGSNHKKMGRKFQSVATENRHLRETSDPDEMYAAVTKIFGNGMCEVMCNDSKSRLCIIRNKFRGRGKRDNTVAIGVWVMVGIRSWEVCAGGKLQKCDLLEVYKENEKQKLKKLNHVQLSKIAPDINNTELSATTDDNMIEFSNIDQSATENIIQEMTKDTNDESLKNNIIDDEGELVSIDDI